MKEKALEFYVLRYSDKNQRDAYKRFATRETAIKWISENFKNVAYEGDENNITARHYSRHISKGDDEFVWIEREDFPKYDCRLYFNGGYFCRYTNAETNKVEIFPMVHISPERISVIYDD